MTALMVLLISSVFVLAAMVGLADAIVHFVGWSIDRLRTPRKVREAVHRPAQGITA